MAGSFDVKVNLNNNLTDERNKDRTVQIHKPSFTLPIRAGAWKLMIFHQWKLLGENNFLVLPLIYWKGLPVNSVNVKELNDGPPRGKYYNHNFTGVEAFLKLRENPDLDRLAYHNALKVGSELIQWCLDLVSDFWTIHDICRISPSSQCDFFVAKTCTTTTWSSLFPDLKAALP